MRLLNLESCLVLVSSGGDGAAPGGQERGRRTIVVVAGVGRYCTSFASLACSWVFGLRSHGLYPDLGVYKRTVEGTVLALDSSYVFSWIPVASVVYTR